MTSAAALHQLQQCVQAALPYVDANGAFRAADVAGLRACLAEHAPAFRLASHPAAIFGPWTSLPPMVQETLRRAVERQTTRAMDFHPRGALWPGLVGQWMTMQRALERRAVAPELLALGDRWAARLWAGPARLAEQAYRRRRLYRWRNGRSVTLEDLLVALGRSPHWLLGDFVSGVRVDPRCRGFHWSAERNIGFGQLVGVDLIPTDDDTWCVEANISTAFNESRRAVLSPEPSVDVLFREAADAGVRHVIWQDMERSEVRVWLIEELRAAAAQHGMTVSILESRRIPRRDDLPPSLHPPGKFITSPRVAVNDTLVLRRNSYPVGSDYLIADKAAFVRGMRRALFERSDTRVRIPAMAGSAAEVFAPARPGLPNLVYKYPDLEKGEGVFFLRVDHPGEAERLAREIDAESGEPPGLFQQFVCSRLLEGRRVYDVRCELLITPRGARHVFSIRREAMQSLPAALENGRVRSPGVFTSNLATGGRFAPVGAAEAEQVREAALAVGDALVAELRATFDTGDGA